MRPGDLDAGGGGDVGWTTGRPVAVCVGHALLPDSCYQFTIMDSYGDGICCGFRNSSYTVFTDQLGNFATGGNFDRGEHALLRVPQRGYRRGSPGWTWQRHYPDGRAVFAPPER